MAEHPYFTRSKDPKDPKDSFSDQHLSKGKEKVVENVENTNLTEITLNDPIIAEQNKLIAQLFQQIAEMRAEMDKTRDLTNLAIIANTSTPDNGRPPLHFPTLDPTSDYFPNNLSTATNPKPPIIDLTTLNPHHASSSHQKLPTPPKPNTNTFQNFPPVHQTLTQIVENPPTTQPIPLETAFHLPISPESYPPFAPHFESGHHEKKEKECKNIREEVMNAMKDFRYTTDIVGLNYEDLCIHPHLELPEGFKVPKFETFCGLENPLTHLRAYCDQLIGVGKDEALLMLLFSRSLKGEALEWFISKKSNQWPSWNALAKEFIERFGYNVEFIPDRYSLERIKQNSTESYREYAYRWRREAARVRPPMTEKEIIEVFVRIQEPEYYNRMLLILGGKFSEIVKVGEAIEDGLKTGKIIRITPQDEFSGPLRRKREDVSSISFESSQKSKRHASLNVRKSLPSKTYPLAPQNSYLIQPNYQTPPPNHPNYQAPLPNYPNALHRYQAPQYQNFQTSAHTRQNPPSCRQVPLLSRNNYNLSCHEYLKKPSRVFTPLIESRSQLFERLKVAGLVRTIDPKNVNVNSRLYRPDLHCAYHSGGAGHTTEDCINLKHKIQDLIDQRIVTLRTVASNASGDSLWNRGGFAINMIDPKFQTPPRQNTPYHHQLPLPQHGGQYDPPRSRFERKPARKFTPLIESRTKLFERLTAADFIHPVGPKPVDTSSKFYRADRRCAYHSNSVGHDTEDCINLKHKIQDLIDQRVVTLQTATPSVNSNPPLNYGRATINMIETEEEWCTTKAIVPAGPDNLERVIASSSINEKLNFTSVTPHQAFALVSREGQNKKGINHVPPKSLPYFCQSFLVEEYANDDDFGEGIGDRCEEGDVAPKKMIETPSMRDAESMEQVLNWTFTPLLIPRSS